MELPNERHESKYVWGSPHRPFNIACVVRKYEKQNTATERSLGELPTGPRTVIEGKWCQSRVCRRGTILSKAAKLSLASTTGRVLACGEARGEK